MAVPGRIPVQTAGSRGHRRPPGLWAFAATVVLVRKADKLTLGQNVNVKVPQAITALMNSQGHKWLTNSWMIHYQGLLCENPQVQLETMQMLNPTTFLPFYLFTYSYPIITVRRS